MTDLDELTDDMLFAIANYPNVSQTCDALRARISELEGALKQGVTLIKGDAVGKEWKSGCASFLRTASRALGGEND